MWFFTNPLRFEDFALLCCPNMSKNSFGNLHLVFLPHCSVFIFQNTLFLIDDAKVLIKFETAKDFSDFFMNLTFFHHYTLLYINEKAVISTLFRVLSQLWENILSFIGMFLCGSFFYLLMLSFTLCIFIMFKCRYNIIIQWRTEG